jgi:dipeptidyl aminopeptidase/acylaminoacyl peptidase
MILALLACAWASVAAAAPLAAYSKLPEFEAAAISPSGHAVAMVVTNGEQRVIMVRDLKTGKFISRTATGDVKVRQVRWADDRRLLVVTSVTAAPMDLMTSKREWYMGFIVDLQSQKIMPMLRDVQYAMNTIFDMPVVRTVKGEPMVFVQGMRVAGQGRLSLYRVDLDNARSKLVGEGGDNTRDWVVGIDGEPLAQEVYEAVSGRWLMRMRTPGVGWREVMSARATLDPPYMISQGRSPGSILYGAPDGKDRWSWHETNLDVAATPTPPIEFAGEQGVILSPSDGRLIGISRRRGDDVAVDFFDPVDARNWRAVQAAFPGDRVSLESWSYDRRKIIVSVDSLKEGPAYALVDIDTREAKWLGSSYAELEAKDIGERRPISFKAADGLALTGYLTLPPGKPAKNLPLIVFPHGGPAARDSAGFDWWSQAMASRGYAILQVNFRGSDGLGKKLLEAGYGEWGRKMQTDLSDGVRHLAGQGLVDPKRVCIIGASYGGYAALAGAAFDGDVYRCAVSVAGVADLKRQVTYSRSMGGISTQRYWHRFMGADDPNAPILAERSPARHIEAIKIPILLIHGQDDTVVHPEQSKIMAEALRKAGKPVELVMQKGADHWLSRGDTRLQTLESLVAFVEKHNPPT